MLTGPQGPEKPALGSVSMEISVKDKPRARGQHQAPKGEKHRVPHSSSRKHRTSREPAELAKAAQDIGLGGGNDRPCGSPHEGTRCRILSIEKGCRLLNASRAARSGKTCGGKCFHGNLSKRIHTHRETRTHTQRDTHTQTPPRCASGAPPPYITVTL